MPQARFLIVTRQLFFEILIVLVVLGMFYWFIGRQVFDRAWAEIAFRQHYGADWKQHYVEEMHVTVEENHKKLLVGGGGMVAAGVLSYLIYRQLVPKQPTRRRRRRHSHRHASSEQADDRAE
ncbi:hypothetical protein CfE428DRAFT_6213 [Chthoniobacter flavus Ellin428]|uniref:Uncharacterized protein n=1 Tax=Chthoniobacter flavus Ellin428 TaxID=497964 RepID=B4DBC2_9BACT|nr:hypothetical protein [Chthoniobacter flavus]EDY16212.1 hypothetical protein CfE428DRAFT_6213 [Chthoniobacter flavus Ellin428]TCO84398.1 hypothetical protein EV701_13648 [Chthoniobacter flavus]